MTWKFWCTNPTKAARRYTQRFAAIMVVYLLTVYAVTGYVRNHHLAGAELYLMAALPTVPVIAMLVVVGLYLREERDEFKRHQMVVSMLWAIAVTLGFTAFTDFLRSYNAIVATPPFTEFTVFWIVMGIVGAIQSIRNRVGNDDEQVA